MDLEIALFHKWHSGVRVYTIRVSINLVIILHDSKMKGLRGLKGVSAIIIVSIIITSSISLVNSQMLLPGHKYSGPFISEIMSKPISPISSQVSALLNDEVDVIANSISPSYLYELNDAESIETSKVLRNGYFYFSINTEEYPFNITEFRRAFAFAFDKTALVHNVWNDLAFPLDSCVPRNNPYSIEEIMDYHYYDANFSYAIQLLDNAGFLDIDSDGYREAPNGMDFDVEVSYCNILAGGAATVDLAVSALQAIGINAFGVEEQYYGYLTRIYALHSYDVAYLVRSFPTLDVNWLAHEFSSSSRTLYGFSTARFSNDTLDTYIDELLRSTDSDAVREAAFEIQKILVYQCPEIVVCQNFIISAYRTDKFEGFIPDINEGSFGWWTWQRVHLKQGDTPIGGTLRICTLSDVESFNTMRILTNYGQLDIQYLLYDSLIKIGPNGEDIPWLAESYIIETHADNPSVPEGYTQITFDIRQNITWSDGNQLTAEDVAFTMNYYRDESVSKYLPDLWNMTQAVAMTDYRVRFRFNTESFWHLHSIAYMPILPKHIFVDFEHGEWNDWEPLPNDPTLVTSGPFILNSYNPTELIILENNNNYFFGVPQCQLKPIYSTTGISGPNIAPTLAGSIIASSSIILIGTIILTRKRQEA